MRETSLSINVGDDRFHVLRFEAGEAPAAEAPDAAARDIVLLHGWPNSGRVWRPLADALLLAGQGYRLFAPDLRGFGDSDPGDPSRYRCAGFADDVGEITSALGLTRYALVGHSMSGKIAALLAARRPPGLAALVLIAPSPLTVAAPTPEEKKAAQRDAQGDPEKTASLVLGMAARPLPADAQAMLIEDGLRAASQAWRGWIDAMRDEDFAAEAGRVAAPTLVVGGAGDLLRSEEVLRRDVADRIPGARYASLPAVGHLPHLEDPAALALLLANFLDHCLPEGATP
jgi:pimeloyl-ACP methyl ester carboxylesterase